MKSEKEIWLDQVELKQLLEGGLYWKDIETKLSPGSTEGFKRTVLKEDVSIDDIIWEPYVNKTYPETLQEEPQTESDEIRSILLGEENQEKQKSDLDQEVIKDRLINLNYLQEDYLQEEALASVPHAAVEEDSEVKYEEKDAFSSSDIATHLQPEEASSWLTPENKNKHFDDDDFMSELENKGTPFGGLKLIILLIVSATVTFGVWYYFLSR